MMKTLPSWISPFLKQCYVTLGVSLNIAGQGFVVGYTAILLPQLREPGSDIMVDEASGSWIASILSFAMIAANLLASTVLTLFLGRKSINLLSLLPMILGWACIYFARDVTWLLVARLLQGLSIGFSAYLGPILIGEYTSPKNRGAFLTTVSIGTAAGNFLTHTLGMYYSWRTVSLIIAVIGIVNVLLVLTSPESPSWLINQGKYDEGRKGFRWLRGNDEDEELEAMIAANIQLRESKSDMKQSVMDKFKSDVTYLKETIVKKEFYKPIFIMAHIYGISQWAGPNMMSAYTLDVFNLVITPPFDAAMMILSVDIHRTALNAISVFIIKKVKRRTVLLSTVSLAILIFLLIAGYTYAKSINILPFDHPMIGIFLVHMMTFTIATGTVPVVFIIAGELFPLEYRSIAGGISVFFYSLNFFAALKTAPYLFNHVGITGTACIYAAIVAYCLAVIWKYLPETKDRTLQDIEDEFRGAKRVQKDDTKTKNVQTIEFKDKYVTKGFA